MTLVKKLDNNKYVSLDENVVIQYIKNELHIKQIKENTTSIIFNPQLDANNNIVLPPNYILVSGETYKIAKLLFENDWYLGECDDEYLNFDNIDKCSVSIDSNEVVFVDDCGDFSHINLDCYAVIGRLYMLYNDEIKFTSLFK